MKTLPKTITARVNQLAHRAGQQHALVVRESILKALQILVDGGTTLPELAVAMSGIEDGMAGIAPGVGKAWPILANTDSPARFLRPQN